jgi:hypothetical protein
MPNTHSFLVSKMRQTAYPKCMVSQLSAPALLLPGVKLLSSLPSTFALRETYTLPDIESVYVVMSLST